MFKIQIVEDYDTLSSEAFKVMKAIVDEKIHPVLGLATGSSPVGLYKKMIADHKNGTSYAKCVTFNLDEYIGLPRDHEQTYWTFMHENLFDGLDIPEENIHLPNGVETDHEKACSDYEASMKGYDVDVQLLGLGADGHIGFNEPGTAFDSLTHIAKLTQKTREDNARFFASLDEVPTEAITMGIGTIMRAKKLLVIANGANKADAVYHMMKGEISEDWPCSILQNHPDVVVIVDKAAASKLD